MHQFTRTKALGGQQLLRLQQLQASSDDLIHRTHLQQQLNPESKPTKAAPPSSRTVEAVLEARQSTHGSTAVRLRSKIEEARGNIRTERCERPDRHYRHQQQRRVEDDSSNQSHEPLIPPLFTTTVARSRTTSSSCVANSEDLAVVIDGASTRTRIRGNTTATSTRRTIGAVRRRNNLEREPASEQQTKRKLSKEELEWVEKQLQFTQRAAMLERECESWWRQFYSASGVSSGPASATAAQIQKSFEEQGSQRAQDARQMKQQLHALRQKLRDVAEKLNHMRNGETFYADLQALIEDLEASIAAFRRSQRERYDRFAMDEKVLEKELKTFAEKMNDWESEASNNSNISSARGAATGKGNRRATSRTALTRAGSKGALQGEADTTSDDPAEAEDAEEQTNESDMMARVRRLNDLILQSGGMKGEWDDREHRVFTSLLVRYGLTDDVLLRSHQFQLKSLHGSPNQESNEDSGAEGGGDGGDAAIDYEATVARFLQKCIKQVVTKSDKAVRCHFIWYLDHIQLIQQKKVAISEWKTRKEQERQQIIHQGLVEDNLETDTNAGASPGQQKLGSGGESAVIDEKKSLLAGKSKAKKEKLLLKWKEEKEKREQEQQRQEKELAREKEAREAKVKLREAFRSRKRQVDGFSYEETDVCFA